MKDLYPDGSEHSGVRRGYWGNELYSIFQQDVTGHHSLHPLTIRSRRGSGIGYGIRDAGYEVRGRGVARYGV